MELHELLRSCFTDTTCDIFLRDTFGARGQEIWDSTSGAWLSRAAGVQKALHDYGLDDRRLFEALVKVRPGRADDVSAVCRRVTGEPFNYVVGEPPASDSFPWTDYRIAMSPGLVRMLRLAAYDARSRGFLTISTSEVVRVYAALQPWVGVALTTKAVAPSPLADEEDPFDGKLGASPCVSKTIHGLARHTERPGTFTEHDVFLDLVRFGSGESARKLAPNGDAMEGVNKLSRDLQIGRVSRHGRLDEA